MKTALVERASTSYQDQSARHTNEFFKQIDNPLLSGRQIVNQAREASLNQCHTCGVANHHCNNFLDNVLRPLGFNLAWSQSSIPCVPKIRQSIESDQNNWERAWPKDNIPFAEFKEQAGDLCFWDKAIVTTDLFGDHSRLTIVHLEHAGILDGKGAVLSTKPQEDSEIFDGDWRLMCNSPSFGTPTAVFRYRKIGTR